jgi:hypothetical protein
VLEEVDAVTSLLSGEDVDRSSCCWRSVLSACGTMAAVGVLEGGTVT